MHPFLDSLTIKIPFIFLSLSYLSLASLWKTFKSIFWRYLSMLRFVKVLIAWSLSFNWPLSLSCLTCNRSIWNSFQHLSIPPLLFLSLYLNWPRLDVYVFPSLFVFFHIALFYCHSTRCKKNTCLRTVKIKLKLGLLHEKMLSNSSEA